MSAKAKVGLATFLTRFAHDSELPAARECAFVHDSRCRLDMINVINNVIQSMAIHSQQNGRTNRIQCSILPCFLNGSRCNFVTPNYSCTQNKPTVHGDAHDVATPRLRPRLKEAANCMLLATDHLDSSAPRASIAAHLSMARTQVMCPLTHGALHGVTET
jgi:hypothetical protein